MGLHPDLSLNGVAGHCPSPLSYCCSWCLGLGEPPFARGFRMRRRWNESAPSEPSRRSFPRQAVWSDVLFGCRAGSASRPTCGEKSLRVHMHPYGRSLATLGGPVPKTENGAKSMRNDDPVERKEIKVETQRRRRERCQGRDERAGNAKKARPRLSSLALPQFLLRTVCPGSFVFLQLPERRLNRGSLRGAAAAGQALHLN